VVGGVAQEIWMSMATVPVWAIFVATIIVVMMATEAGFRLGRHIRQTPEDEKESAVSAIAAAILTLTGFMLAFTFGISSDRLQDRKTLVRDEANAITTAWLRSDFLPEPDRTEAKGLLGKYVHDRLEAVQRHDLKHVEKGLDDSRRIQHQLWDTAVKNARKDMNSDVAALYIDSLNELVNIYNLRVAIALHPQIPGILWLVLYALVILGMMAIGFQTAITGSSRGSHAVSLLALSFSLVIGLIAVLDFPQNDIIEVPQGPLFDLRAVMAEGGETGKDLGHSP
jgi:hypothetical protein